MLVDISNNDPIVQKYLIDLKECKRISHKWFELDGTLTKEAKIKCDAIPGETQHQYHLGEPLVLYALTLPRTNISSIKDNTPTQRPRQYGFKRKSVPKHISSFTTSSCSPNTSSSTSTIAPSGNSRGHKLRRKCDILLTRHNNINRIYQRMRDWPYTVDPDYLQRSLNDYYDIEYRLNGMDLTESVNLKQPCNGLWILLDKAENLATLWTLAYLESEPVSRTGLWLKLRGVTITICKSFFFMFAFFFLN